MWSWENKQDFLKLSFLFFMVIAALFKCADELRMPRSYSKHSSSLPPFGQKYILKRSLAACSSAQNKTFLLPFLKECIRVFLSRDDKLSSGQNMTNVIHTLTPCPSLPHSFVSRCHSVPGAVSTNSINIISICAAKEEFVFLPAST